MQVRVVAVYDFTAGEARIAGRLRSNRGVWTACAEEGLGETVGKQRFADMLRASQQVRVAHLLRGQYTAQQVDGMLMTGDVPA